MQDEMPDRGRAQQAGRDQEAADHEEDLDRALQRIEQEIEQGRIGQRIAPPAFQPGPAPDMAQKDEKGA